MAIFRNAGRWDRSNVSTDGQWVRRYDKVSNDPELDHIDYGAIALRRNVVAGLPVDVPRGLDVIQHDLAERGRLRACIVTERFYEIGSPEGLADLDRHLRAPSKTAPDAKL
jgi:MurNAc alpha-1-phosphate uridylyltransferase